MWKGIKASSLPKGGIYDVSFGYHSKMGGYTTSLSDIPKLCVIQKSNLRKIYKSSK
jgi:hypothetical protein